MTLPAYDVAVIGGGPGGAATAAFLARAGFNVGLFERERFPRMRVGESMLPAMLPLLDRLGVGEAVAAQGFLPKYGAMFHDQESQLENTFYFAPGKPWPPFAYQMPRAEFDTLLLEHARKQGVHVHQPATVESVAFDDAGVTINARTGDDTMTTSARFLVDASGRDSFLATRTGTRTRIPNLGKVALFAHFRGAARATGRDEGCRRVSEGLAGAERITPVYPVANFSYMNRPCVGDRFLCVGDTIAFVDPIFSGGVFIAMQSGELAAAAIERAFRDGRFKAARFASYERAVRRGLAPFFRMIHKYYEPAFLELFLSPGARNTVVDAVLSVLAGGFFQRLPWRTRLSLSLLFLGARINTWVRRRHGRPVASRLEW